MRVSEISSERFDLIKRSSYQSFHAEGLNYVCLARGGERSVKYYFYDEAGDRPHLVHPHNHRYNFYTTVMRGSIVDFRYIPAIGTEGRSFDVYDYYSPLVFADDVKTFTKRSMPARLSLSHELDLEKGESLYSPAGAIHTIRPFVGSVIKLECGPVVTDAGSPTQLYCPDYEVPALPDAAYQPIDDEQLTDYLHQLEELELEADNEGWLL